jgi:hypothetical protein
MFRAVVVGVALVVSASAAHAQITTYIAPPRAKATPQMVAAADSARADSAAAVAMTNMKSWVDSAAGVTVPANVGDTTRADSVPPAVVTTFTDGSVAPNTASALPAIAVFGVVTLAAGAMLLVTGRARG